MATIQEWREQVEKASSTDLRAYKDALRSLSLWDFFTTQYAGYGLPQIASIIDAELAKREKELERWTAELKLGDAWNSQKNN